MDKKIFDMLDLYKKMNNSEKAINENEMLNRNYCLETDYSAVNPEILTMAIINMQPIDNVYESEEGFSRGTIFPNIDKPFMGCKKL